MRASLFHRTQPRHRRRGGPLPRLRRGATRRLSATPGPPPAGDRTSVAGGRAGEADAEQAEAGTQRSEADTAVGRARAAGGPVDVATYTCSCGMLFSAPVSTTVACPHCGCEQAW